MRKINNLSKLLLLSFILTGLGALYADDLVFDSFAEAQKAAQQRAAEYDKRMKEHVAKVDNAWEKQNKDLGEDAKYDANKITETRKTEQTSENNDNSKLQDSVTDSINNLKQQMVNSANSNTVGFAGASAAYSWRVFKKDGKYVLSDTYDEAFFVSGASKSTTEKTTEPGTPGNPENPGTPGNPGTTPNNPNNNDDNKDNNNDDVYEEPPSTEVATVEPVAEPSPATNNVELTKADREVEITIQHPISFKEESVKVTEGSEPVKLTLPNGFNVPEDTRVKISAKANMEVENTWLTMTIIDDEGESEPIDSVSMKNYRHLFRIPSDNAYSVNIYVNEEGKEPRKIMQLCVPVKSVDFDSRTISNSR